MEESPWAIRAGVALMLLQIAYVLFWVGFGNWTSLGL